MREGKHIAAVAMPWQVQRIRAESVACEIFSEIHHQAAIGGKPVQQNDAAGGFYIRGRIENGHRCVAAACVEPQFLLGKFRDANPSRAKSEKYDACDRENDLPELHWALRDVCTRHARIMCLCFSASAERGMGNWLLSR